MPVTGGGNSSQSCRFQVLLCELLIFLNLHFSFCVNISTFLAWTEQYFFPQKNYSKHLTVLKFTTNSTYPVQTNVSLWGRAEVLWRIKERLWLPAAHIYCSALNQLDLSWTSSFWAGQTFQPSAETVLFAVFCSHIRLLPLLLLFFFFSVSVLGSDVVLFKVDSVN